MSRLICPTCKAAGLNWVDPDDPDLLESGLMRCENAECKAEFKGIPEWQAK